MTSALDRIHDMREKLAHRERKFRTASKEAKSECAEGCMRFQVKGVHLIDRDTVRLTLEGLAEGVRPAYASELILRLPVEDLPLYYLGREMELDLPQHPPYRGTMVDELEETVTTAMGNKPAESDYRQ